MSARDLFQIEYRLLSLQEVYGQNVSPDYYSDIPPEYWVGANVNFYLNDNCFFAEEGFSIFKFVLDASYWFKHGFPNSEFVWNEDYFDGWEGVIAIAPMDSQVLFRIDCEEKIEVSIAIDSFEKGFAKFVNEFQATAESFWEMSFNLT